jgi:uncharacterized protein YjbI with pentapeptide repeats
MKGVVPHGAHLHGAHMHGADMQGADLLGMPLALYQRAHHTSYLAIHR